MNQREIDFIEAGWRSNLSPMPAQVELDRLVALGKRERNRYVADMFTLFFEALGAAVAQVRYTAAECTAARTRVELG